ncbi:MAG: hypothetical protein ABSF90_18675 [Syntrophobacteraceae bacterium]
MEALTREEARAISALKRVAKIWPDTLWLFSASGTLTVMRKKDGRHARLASTGGGIDPDFFLTTIDIENDGGDW